MHKGYINQRILSLIKQTFIIHHGENGIDNDDKVDWDDKSKLMVAAVLEVVNNNIAIMNMMKLASQKQEGQDWMQMINDFMMPTQQDLRRQPRWLGQRFLPIQWNCLVLECPWYSRWSAKPTFQSQQFPDALLIVVDLSSQNFRGCRENWFSLLFISCKSYRHEGCITWSRNTVSQWKCLPLELRNMYIRTTFKCQSPKCCKEFANMMQLKYYIKSKIFNLRRMICLPICCYSTASRGCGQQVRRGLLLRCRRESARRHLCGRARFMTTQRCWSLLVIIPWRTFLLICNNAGRAPRWKRTSGVVSWLGVHGGVTIMFVHSLWMWIITQNQIVTTSNLA